MEDILAAENCAFDDSSGEVVRKCENVALSIVSASRSWRTAASEATTGFSSSRQAAQPCLKRVYDGACTEI
jgi:hypothetical protein